MGFRVSATGKLAAEMDTAAQAASEAQAWVTDGFEDVVITDGQGQTYALDEFAASLDGGKWTEEV
jgi:hypothetical protein